MNAAILPVTPVIRIRPPAPRATQDLPELLRELWSARELLGFLAWRDLKVRYQQTALGFGWAILQPLLTLLVFMLFFGRLAKLDAEEIPYPLFALAGLLPWTYFANAVQSACNSLNSNSALLTKVYFPRIVIPAAAMLAAGVDFAIGLCLLAPLMIWFRVVPGVSFFSFPLLFALLGLFTLAMGIWLARLSVRYRDVRYVLPFLLQLWMLATPIIYGSKLIPAQWRWALLFNPLAVVIEGFRAALFARPLPWPALTLTLVISLLLLLYATVSFRRSELEFADTI